MQSQISGLASVGFEFDRTAPGPSRGPGGLGLGGGPVRSGSMGLSGRGADFVAGVGFAFRGRPARVGFGFHGDRALHRNACRRDCLWDNWENRKIRDLRFDIPDLLFSPDNHNLPQRREKICKARRPGEVGWVRISRSPGEVGWVRISREAPSPGWGRLHLASPKNGKRRLRSSFEGCEPYSQTSNASANFTALPFSSP